MLRTVVARHRGEIVKSTGDGFFAAFDVGARGGRCGRARSSAPCVDHRDTSGFALSVRIGLHTRRRDTRAGPTTAARASMSRRASRAQAKGGEVLATAETIAEAGDVPTTADPTPTALKGVTEPVSLAPISWA